jgi:hypothetical protein
MSGGCSAVENSMEEIIIDLMEENFMSARAHASSKRGLQASPLTACRSGPSRTATEKRRKHRYDLENVKLIPSILPRYILPLSGAVSCDSILRDFDYTLITVYLLKGIRAVGSQLGQILILNISDFNLGDHKNYGMLTPHKYLTKTTGKKPNIVPQPWTMDITRSTMLNVMKIPHFNRHQGVNTCVKILLSCYHGGYLWLDRRITIDSALIHQITKLSMQGPDPQEFYPGKVVDRTLELHIKDTYDDVEKGKRGYKVASIQNGVVHLAFHLIASKLGRNE